MNIDLVETTVAETAVARVVVLIGTEGVYLDGTVHVRRGVQVLRGRV